MKNFNFNIKKRPQPILTIGLPVFNEEKKINKVLTSLYNQTYKKFIIIISDNCSNDKTLKICKKWKKKKKNLVIFSQKKKLKINQNFYFVYSKSKTNYFMWMAADDFKSKNFIKDNLNFLEKNPKYSASCCKNIRETNKFKKLKTIDFKITGNMSSKYSKFFNHCFESHGVFYSVFRRIDLTRSKKYLNYMAWDWIVNLLILENGDFNRLKKGYLKSTHGGISTRPNYLFNSSDNLIHKIFPFYKFTTFVLNNAFKNDFSLNNFLNIWFNIFKINFRYLKRQFKYKFTN